MTSIKKKLESNDLLVFTAKANDYHYKNHKQFSWVKKDKNKYQVSLKKILKILKKAKF